MTLSRFALSLLNALVVTAGLLLLMYSLIASDEPELEFVEPLSFSGWAKPPEDIDVQLIAVKPKAPELLTESPKRFQPKVVFDGRGIKTSSLDMPLTSIKPTLGVPSDGQLSLAFSVPPAYPTRLASRGTEGYVIVGFSVSAAGTVFDPYIVEAFPSTGFNRAALNAIKRFKYLPRQIAGKAVATDGQFYKFVFELAQ